MIACVVSRKCVFRSNEKYANGIRKKNKKNDEFQRWKFHLVSLPLPLPYHNPITITNGEMMDNFMLSFMKNLFIFSLSLIFISEEGLLITIMQLICTSKKRNGSPVLFNLSMFIDHNRFLWFMNEWQKFLFGFFFISCLLFEMTAVVWYYSRAVDNQPQIP